MKKTFGEFKSDFDLLYNNINNAAAPGFTDAEIAQIAQRATEDVCQAVYNGTLKAEGFEVTEEVTAYINGLIKQQVFTEEGVQAKNASGQPLYYTDSTKTETTTTETDYPVIIDKFEENPKTVLDIQAGDTFKVRVCKLGDDKEIFWFIVYEAVKYKDGDDCLDGSNVCVKPITHDNLYRIMQNPFVGRTSNRVERLSIDNKVELLSYKKEIAEYLVRYMEKPKFRISVSSIADSDLILEDINDSLYGIILKQTVNNAKSIWAS